MIPVYIFVISSATLERLVVVLDIIHHQNGYLIYVIDILFHQDLVLFISHHFIPVKVGKLVKLKSCERLRAYVQV